MVFLVLDGRSRVGDVFSRIRLGTIVKIVNGEFIKREEEREPTVTTVSLAPASPPARILVSVEVDCFLSIVKDV